MRSLPTRNHRTLCQQRGSRSSRCRPCSVPAGERGRQRIPVCSARSACRKRTDPYLTTEPGNNLQLAALGACGGGAPRQHRGRGTAPCPGPVPPPCPGLADPPHPSAAPRGALLPSLCPESVRCPLSPGLLCPSRSSGASACVPLPGLRQGWQGQRHEGRAGPAAAACHPRSLPPPRAGLRVLGPGCPKGCVDFNISAE